MAMRTGNVLFSAVHFFIVLVILGIGGFFIALAKIPHVRFIFSQLFSDQYAIFFPLEFPL